MDDARRARVLYPIKDVGPLQLTDEAVLVERYGVNGSQYVDFAAIQAAAADPHSKLTPAQRKRLLDALATANT